MPVDRFVYRRADRLPGLTLNWDDDDGDPIDFQSVGHTFAVELVPDAGGDPVTVAGSITGGSGTVTIAWGADDLDVDGGPYRLWATATEVASGKSRTFNPDSPPIIQIVED